MFGIFYLFIVIMFLIMRKGPTGMHLATSSLTAPDLVHSRCHKVKSKVPKAPHCQIEHLIKHFINTH